LQHRHEFCAATEAEIIAVRILGILAIGVEATDRHIQVVDAAVAIYDIAVASQCADMGIIGLDITQKCKKL
jgi:hypothetical protein